MIFFKKLSFIYFSDGFHLDKKTLSERKRFPLDRKPVPPDGMKDFVEKYFST